MRRYSVSFKKSNPDEKLPIIISSQAQNQENVHPNASDHKIIQIEAPSLFAFHFG